jgi:hypothetical protein
MHEMGIKTDHRSRRIYVIESNLPPRNTKHSRTLFQIKTEKKAIQNTLTNRFLNSANWVAIRDRN